MLAREKEPVHKWKLVDYFDVWSNEEDGYWVNDLAVLFDDLYITEDASDREIFDYLKDVAKYSRLQDLKFEDVSWDGDDFFIELTTEREYGEYPLCRLERVMT